MTLFLTLIALVFNRWIYTQYFPETDTAIIQNTDSTVQCDGFRAGCSSEISDELLAEIDRLIEEQNWDALSDLDANDVQLISKDGKIFYLPDEN